MNNDIYKHFFFFFFHESMPRIPLTDSQIPTLNVHYRTFFVSKSQESMHASDSTNKLASFLVDFAMNIEAIFTLKFY